MSQTHHEARTLRQWSDALAGAGLFALALQTYPAEQTPEGRSDLFRPAELAVLAADHAAAVRLLKEYETGREPADSSETDEPAVVLLMAVARAQAGEPTGWAEVQDAAAKFPGTAWTSWMVALGGVTVPDLSVAGPAAQRALAGGCRDPRLPVIAAAGLAADGAELTWEHCAEAVRLLERSRLVQLPTEDALGATLELLRRAGFSERASGLAAYAVTDPQVPHAAARAWREAARARTISVPRRGLRERLALRRDGANTRSQRPPEDAASQDLTCICAGSTGWIGPNRSHFVEHHLTEVDPAPIAGIDARLLHCRLTGIRFLDLTELMLTLPVDAT